MRKKKAMDADLWIKDKNASENAALSDINEQALKKKEKTTFKINYKIHKNFCREKSSIYDL